MSRRFDQLLLDLYACPEDPGGWPVVLDQVCRETGARCAVVQWLVNDGARPWTRWMVRDSNASADAQIHDRYLGDTVNPRLRSDRGPSLHASRTILRDRDFFAPGHPDRADLRERLAAIRLGSFMGAGISVSKGEWLVLVLHRDVDDRRDFGGDEEQFAESLLPHLRQSVRLAERFAITRTHHAELEGTLSSLKIALMTCGPDARLAWANQSALRLLERRTLLSLSADRVSAASSAHDTFVLRRMITEAANGVCPTDAHVVLRDASNTEALQILVRPLATERRGDIRDPRPEGRVLLMAVEPGTTPSLPPQIISRMFALSAAESRLTAGLCSGLSPNEYAARNGVSVETVRSQLKQVLAKTQSGRQADLVRLVCSSVIAHVLERDS